MDDMPLGEIRQDLVRVENLNRIVSDVMSFFASTLHIAPCLERRLKIREDKSSTCTRLSLGSFDECIDALLLVHFQSAVAKLTSRWNAK